MANEALVAQAQSLSPTEILEKVDAFYKTSWDHLLTYGTVAGWVVGIVVILIGGVLPIVLQWVQSRAFKREEAAISSAIKAQVEAARVELAEAHRKELAATIAAHDAQVNASLAAVKQEYAKQLAHERIKMHRRFLRLNGGVFFVQGTVELRQKSYAAATVSFQEAVGELVRARDEMNLRRAADMLINQCLPKLDKEALKQYEEDIPGRIAKLQGLLKKRDRNGEYRDMCVLLNKAMTAAQERVPSAPSKTANSEQRKA